MTTFEQLTGDQQRIMEDAWDMYNHSWGGHMTPIGEHTHASSDSSYEKLTDMKLLHRVLVMAGWKHNEYGYEITPAGIQLMQETKYVKGRLYRAELLRKLRDGEITEAQFLDGLENGQAS